MRAWPRRRDGFVVAILVVGLLPWNDDAGGHTESDVAEGEAHDRVHIGLPDEQRALVRAVLAAQPKTILVVISGGVVSEPTLMQGAAAPPAVVQAFYGGEEHGTALAMALLGESAFSGRLPVTIVHSLAQLPPYLTQQMSAPPGRTHRYLSTAPLFPFGFGLTSHAAAHYARLRVTPASVPANAPAGLNITVEVELSALAVQPAIGARAESHAGAVQQDEVVECFFGWVGSSGTDTDATAAEREAGKSSVALHELKAFRRVTLPPAGSLEPLTVAFTVSVASLRLMRADGSMGLLRGRWKVWVGGTSPRTPARLLRAGHASGGDQTSGGSVGAPQEPLVAEWSVTH